MGDSQAKLVIELGQCYQLRCGAKVILKGYTSCFTYGDVFYQKMFADLIDGFDLLITKD